MTDTNANAADAKGENGAGADHKAGEDPAKKPDNQSSQAFDPSKVSDEDFGKIFDDPRTFQHSRFKELTAAKKELNQFKESQAKAEEDRLKKQGEYQTLSEQKQKEADELRSQLTNERINNRLLAAANKLNVVDPDAVLKLVDRSGIKTDGDTVTGVEEALKSLVESKPYLTGKPGTQKLGAGSNPTNQNTGELKRFKHSEITDPKFYRENEKDILASMAANLIENDL